MCGEYLQFWRVSYTRNNDEAWSITGLDWPTWSYPHDGKTATEHFGVMESFGQVMLVGL